MIKRWLLLALLAAGLLGCTPAPAEIAQPNTPIPSVTPTMPPTPTSTALATTAMPTLEVPSPTLVALTAVASVTPAFSYPIGIAGRTLGDGFYIRDAYAVENTWYKPGWWHTAEDWYALEGSTAGAQVYAISAGEVVYADANYPGRVVIIRHQDDLFSMYGHLEPALAVTAGQRVARGQLLGTVRPGWEQAPAHLHFEIRSFLTTRAVNGAAPRYRYPCGVNCPPGPGYWPIDAPEHPSALGWRNPTHVIAQRMFPQATSGPLGEVVVPTQPISASVTLWSAPPDAEAQQALGELALPPSARFPLLAVHAGAEDSQQTSAAAYALWYRIRAPDGREGWVQAALASQREVGSDGRPAAVVFILLPADR